MSLPLAGCRVLITRPKEQSTELCHRLEELGALPLLFPVIAIAAPEPGGPLDEALARRAAYDWVVFTSVNGVKHFFERLAGLNQGSGESPQQMLGTRSQVAAIGPATAAALEAIGVAVSLLPGEYRATALLQQFVGGEGARAAVRGRRFLLARADIAPPELATGLRAAGAQVDEVAAYHTVAVTPSPEALTALRRGVDVITFTSSSIVEHFLALAGEIDFGEPLIACIGPVTAQTARRAGLEVGVVAEEYTVDGLVGALVAWFGGGGST